MQHQAQGLLQHCLSTDGRGASFPHSAMHGWRPALPHRHAEEQRCIPAVRGNRRPTSSGAVSSARTLNRRSPPGERPKQASVAAPWMPRWRPAARPPSAAGAAPPAPARVRHSQSATQVRCATRCSTREVAGSGISGHKFDVCQDAAS